MHITGPFRPVLRLILLICAALLGSHAAHAQDSAPDPSAPRVRVETTLGNFVIELDTQRAPLTVANFLQYVKAGHYTDTIFHRVIGNFVIQGGGYDPKYVEKPTRDGVPNESGNGLSNRRGTVGLADTLPAALVNHHELAGSGEATGQDEQIRHEARQIEVDHRGVVLEHAINNAARNLVIGFGQRRGNRHQTQQLGDTLHQHAGNTDLGAIQLVQAVYLGSGPQLVRARNPRAQ